MQNFLWAFAAVAALLLAGVFVFGPPQVERGMNRVARHKPWPVSDKARALHSRLTIGDWHGDSLLWDRDLRQRSSRGHMDLPRMRDGNVALQVFATVTKSPAGLNVSRNDAAARDNITLLSIAQLRPTRSWFDLTERALAQAAALRRTAEASPDQVMQILTRGDLDDLLGRRAAGASVNGAILGAEGGHALSGDLANLDRLHGAGFRLLGLTHFFDNELGASLHGTAGADAGLTKFGRDTIARMDDLGMIIDLAHASPRMAREVLTITDAPVVVSHTGIRSLCDTVRNFPDDLMQAVAAKGGLIGIGYWSEVTCDPSPAGVAASIRAAIDLVGEDHVALGSDFDGAVETPFDVSELPALTHALMEADLSETTIAKVMGGNMVRFLRDALPER